LAKHCTGTNWLVGYTDREKKEKQRVDFEIEKKYILF